MKKVLLIAIVICCCFSICSCGNNKEQPVSNNSNSSISVSSESSSKENSSVATKEIIKGDFRNVTWGMTKDEVKKNENSKLSYEEDNGLFFEASNVCNLDASIAYQFNEENKLYDACYSINETHTSEQLYIDDYNNVKSELIAKYGKPTFDEQKWRDDLWKDEPGMALSVGDLLLFSKWETDNTIITNVLGGDNYEISHLITYESKKISKPLSSSNGL